jgi:purine-cytosine permease-like protein
MQNLLGGWRKWKRTYTCLILAAGGALAAWIVNYKELNGFFKVANFLAITVPCATVIMFVDHFGLPRMFKISRPLTKVPAWKDAALINVPAFVALCVSVAYGAFATALWPGEDPSRYWGPAPLTAWIMAGVVYTAGVWVTQRMVAPAQLKQTLGFSKLVIDEEVPLDVAVDIASIAEGKAPPIGFAVSPARSK